VEAKAQIKKNYREGREVSAELIGADQAIQESDSNETIEEAPSIIDELGTKDISRRPTAAANVQSTSTTPLVAKVESKHSSKGSSNISRKSSVDSMKAAGEQVTVLKEVEARLKEEVNIGKEVGKELIKSREEHILELMRRRPVKIQKISHFQAMALMGKALFGALKKDPVKVVESPISSTSSSSSQEYSDNFEESHGSEEDGKTKNVDITANKVERGNSSENEGSRLQSQTKEEAATKIQAGYRGHKARREVAKMRREAENKARLEVHIEEFDIDLDDPNVEKSATMIQSRFRGSQARKSVAKMHEESCIEKPIEEEIDIDLNDPNVEKSATKIQATFRGSKARKEVAKIKEEQQNDAIQEDYTYTNVPTTQEEVIDIDLNDPNVEKSATKIQATFRGSKARKEVAKVREEKNVKISKETNDFKAEEEIDIDMNDPNVERSATKIQATFRGSKARKEVAKIKEEKKIAPGKDGDVDVEKSATIIQSGYRGHLARKEVSKMKEENARNLELKEKDEKSLNDEVDIDLNDPEVHKSATKIQATFRGSKARKEVAKMKDTDSGANLDVSESNISNQTAELAIVKEENIPELPESNKEGNEGKGFTMNWQDPELNNIATNIQAGYKGMKVREEMKAREEAEAACKIQANFRGFRARKQVNRLRREREVEERLGIDLEDPEVSRAATKIQAGFRGMQTRKKLRETRNPHIVVEDTSEYTEMESETSYYEDEEEEEDEDALEERPPTPETSVERFSLEKKESVSTDSRSSETKVKGFRAMAMVAKLMQNRKAKFEEIRRVSEPFEKQSIVTASMPAGEATVSGDKGHEASNQTGNIINVQASEQDDYTQNEDDFEPEEPKSEGDKDEEEEEEEEDEEDDEEDEDEEEEEEPEPVEVKEEKKPFFLLKRLVGIMSLTGGQRTLVKPNKVGIFPQVPESAKGLEEAADSKSATETVESDSKDQSDTVADV
jgi:hypothetical protein